METGTLVKISGVWTFRKVLFPFLSWTRYQINGLGVVNMHSSPSPGWVLGEEMADTVALPSTPPLRGRGHSEKYYRHHTPNPLGEGVRKN